MDLYVKINLITNRFEGRQAVGCSYADFVIELGYLMKNPPKSRVTRPLKLGRVHRRYLDKTSCSYSIYTI